MSSIEPKLMSETMSLREEMFDTSDEEQESSEDYGEGGYLSIKIGDTFLENRYRVIGKLGWGAFSTVWLCADNRLNDYVAIKVVKSKKRFYDSSLEEIQTLTTVQKIGRNDPSSKRVVTLLNHFIAEGVNGKHRCLVLEVLGQSLFKFTKNCFPNGIPVDVLKPIVRQILEGLQYLHTKCKVIHSDIKPENILLVISKAKIEEMHSNVNQLIRNCDKSKLSSCLSTDLTEDQNIDLFCNENKRIENIIQNSGPKLLESFDIFGGISCD